MYASARTVNGLPLATPVRSQASAGKWRKKAKSTRTLATLRDKRRPGRRGCAASLAHRAHRHAPAVLDDLDLDRGEHCARAPSRREHFDLVIVGRLDANGAVQPADLQRPARRQSSGPVERGADRVALGDGEAVDALAPDAEPLHLLVERGRQDAEQRGGAALATADHAEHGQDQAPLVGPEQILEVRRNRLGPDVGVALQHRFCDLHADDSGTPM